ncbi:MAG TPA: hypothetical protein VM899_12335 [Rubellimicrobium sp.]|jgi:hypothetical protein|nr:hypothetical protein [Rubellimicrobium sp.]
MLVVVSSSAADVITVPEETDFTAHDIGIAEYNRNQWVRLRRGDSIGLGAPDEVELLDFWMIVSLRCVMTQVSFGLNGAPAVAPLALEPCHDDLSSRDTLLDQVAFPPVFQTPTGSIRSVEVVVTYVDGTTSRVTLDRDALLR